MQTRHRTITRMLAPVAAFTLVAAACGDDDDDSTPDDEPVTDVGDSVDTTAPEDEMSEDTMSDDTMTDDMTEDTMSEDEMSEDEMSEDTTDDMAEGETIVDLAAGTPELSTLVTAVDTVGLTETLSGEGPYTVFAPTNDAFDTALDDLGVMLDDWLTDPDAVTAVLTYHVVEGEVLSSDITDGMTATTVEGGELTFSTNGEVTVNDVTVVTPDVEASNGVVHIIDGVLFP